LYALGDFGTHPRVEFNCTGQLLLALVLFGEDAPYSQ
jgi:hypothetical protein